MYIISQVSSLKRRVSFLEKNVLNVSTNSIQGSVQVAEPRHKGIAVEPPKPEIHSQSYVQQEPGNLELFLQWLKVDWLMKLGALFVLLAIVWFVRYAIVSGWIGEMGRVAMGMIVSAIILAAGFYQLKKRPIPAQVLMALGTTGILATVFVARSSYDIFTPISAMGIMSFIVLMIAVVAIVNDSLALGVISFFGGIVAPLLTNSHDQNYLFLNSYLLALDCGVFAMVAMKGWRILLPLSLVITGFYTLGTFNEGNLTQTGTQAFMALYYVLFFVGVSSAIVYTKKITLGDAITMAIIVLLGIYWVSEYVPAELRSSALSVAVVFAAITAALAVKIAAPRKIVYLSLGAAVGLLGAATSFELDGQTLTIVLALEAATVIALIRYVLFDIKATIVSTVLLIVPILLALNSFSWGRQPELFNRDFFVLLIVGSAIGFVSIIIYGLLNYKESKDNESAIQWSSLTTAVISGCFFIGLVWRSLETMISSMDTAHGIALVIYTIVSLTMFFAGLSKQNKKMKTLGIIILVGVILRLGFVEIWDMSLTQRTITFIVIGILLITTAFFQKKQQIINK
jgi:uncharacterized membrane protein